MKYIRSILGANIMLLFVFAFLPVLMVKPYIEIMQVLLGYIMKES